MRNSSALDLAAPTWAPWIEKQNKLAQLPVAVFAAGRSPRAQQVPANDSIWRAGEADSHGVPLLCLLCCCPGITHLQLCCLEHSFGVEGFRGLGSWQKERALGVPA